jgi:phage tail sheath protein FI
VYVEELPSGVRTITGVGTSIAAFIGFTPSGPVNRAVRVQSFADYERAFGGLSSAGPLGHAVRQFFLNGGADAHVIRVAAGAQTATVQMRDAGGAASLEVTAAAPGASGNLLRVSIDYETASPESTFNLRVFEMLQDGATLRVGRTETFQGLTMNSTVATYALPVVNTNSQLVRLNRLAPAAAGAGEAFSGPLTAGDLATIDATHNRLAISVNGAGPFEIALAVPLADLNDLATKIAAGLNATGNALAQGTTVAVAVDRIQLVSPVAGDASNVRVLPASVNDGSIRLRFGVVNGGAEIDAVGAIRPAASGSAADVPIDLAAVVTGPLDVTITPRAGAALTDTLTITVPAGTLTRGQVRALVEQVFRQSARDALRLARVALVNDQLVIVAGGDDATRLGFANTLATPLGLTGAVVNVAQYALGTGPTAGRQVQGTSGSDGTPPGPAQVIGSRAARTGLFALEAVDLFNIMALPGQTSGAVLSEALAYCTERRAMLIVDPPQTTRTVDDAQQWLNSIGALRSRNAAAYFPWVVLEDPVNGFRPVEYPPSGTVAGVWARTDTERGVWKAPAGTDAALRGTIDLAARLTDAQNGVLNPLGLNVLRALATFGTVAWGARTLRGADQMADEYKYIPVRRIALFLEESLYRGLHWVVFEPNDESLWAQIRLNVGAFMQTLFRQGAFAGASPREAYFVRCDAETTTQNDINLGVVNIVVGFAPLKPAEFVVIKIQQMAGQVQT